MCIILHNKYSFYDLSKIDLLKQYYLIYYCMLQKTMAQNILGSSIVDYCNGIDEEIMPLLKRTGAVISGSTCLYFVLKELGIEPNFEPDDIDIFITNKHGFHEFNHWFDKLIKHDKIDTRCKTLKVSFYSGKLYTPQPNEMMEYVPPAHNDLISAVRYGYIKNVKIDLVILKHEIDKPSDFINKYFDLDFCKNTFDGNKFDMYDNECVMRMECNLIHNYLSFNKSVAILSFREYEEAIVKNDPTNDDKLRYISRINKYRNRGFKINVDSNFKLKSDLNVIDSADIEEHIAKIKLHKCAQQETLCHFVTGEFIITNMVKNNEKINYRAQGDKDFVNTQTPYFKNLRKKKNYMYHLNRFSFNVNTRFINTDIDSFLNKTNNDIKYIALIALRICNTNMYLFAIEVKQCSSSGDQVISNWHQGNECCPFTFYKCLLSKQDEDEPVTPT